MPSQPVSILVVDDQPRNVIALEAALSTLDCSLVKAYSGRDALRCLLAQDFAVIVLDVHMPGLDGFETATLIRSRERSRSTPIIFLTADDRAGPRVLEGYRLGAVDYMYKPFDPEILRAKVTVFAELFRTSAALIERDELFVTLNAQLEQRVLERTAALEVAIDDLEREAEERRRAEQTLRETELRLQAVIDSTPVVLFAVDTHGVFTLFEGNGMRALGMEPGQGVGQSALVPAADAVGNSLEGAQLIRVGDVTRALHGETFTSIVEASSRVFELKYAPRLDSAGASVGAIGIAVDVSEQHALYRRKDAFVSTVSHELRTPLNGIIAVSQLLLGTSLDLSQQEYVEIIHRSGRALHRLIDDVLTLARYQSGKVTVEDVDLDVRLALEDVTALLFGPAREKGLGIVAHVDHDVPRGLRGDIGRLRQILLNLAVNAVKFTDTGSVLLRARLDHVDGDRVSIRFETQDTGIGIAAEVQSRLFQPFEQADGSATTRYAGTGLGLAICRQLVESMNGRLGLDSVPGKGSTFWFVLPLLRDESLDTLNETQVRGLHILLVCDTPVRAEALREMVGVWSVLATVAGSTARAAELVCADVTDGQVFDAVVIATEDVVGEGIHLVRTLRDQGNPLDRRVILISPPEQLEEIMVREPAVLTISRPVHSAQLFNALERLVGTGSGSTSRSPAGSGIPPMAPASGALVLVVEDAPMNQLVAQRALEYLGYRPTIAESGPVALELLAAFDFAVVLMDCRMPGMDGFETTRRIRRREIVNAERRIPVIALTANAQEGDHESCLAAGMDDYMSKPLDLDELGRMLRRWTAVPEMLPSAAGAAQPTGGAVRPKTVLDPGALAMIRELQAPEDETDLLAEMIEAFLIAAPAHLDQMMDALAQGAPDKLANEAHALKGGAAYLGATELQQLCLEVEMRGRAGVMIGAATLVAALRAALELVCIALNAELDTQAAAA